VKSTYKLWRSSLSSFLQPPVTLFLFVQVFLSASYRRQIIKGTFKYQFIQTESEKGAVPSLDKRISATSLMFPFICTAYTPTHWPVPCLHSESYCLQSPVYNYSVLCFVIACSLNCTREIGHTEGNYSYQYPDTLPPRILHPRHRVVPAASPKHINMDRLANTIINTNNDISKLTCLKSTAVHT
jgi:hypothetical protein